MLAGAYSDTSVWVCGFPLLAAVPQSAYESLSVVASVRTTVLPVGAVGNVVLPQPAGSPAVAPPSQATASTITVPFFRRSVSPSLFRAGMAPYTSAFRPYSAWKPAASAATV